MKKNIKKIAEEALAEAKVRQKNKKGARKSRAQAQVAWFVLCFIKARNQKRLVSELFSRNTENGPFAGKCKWKT